MEESVNSPVKAKLSLLDALKKISTITFDFQLVGHETTAPDKDGKTLKVLVLKLFNPIPYVRGSQKIPMEDGTLRTLELNDVEEIKVIETDAASDSFDMEVDPDTNEVTGTFKGSDLILDISKSNMDVWLRKDSFASVGKGMRTANQQSRLDAVRKRLGVPAKII